MLPFKPKAVFSGKFERKEALRAYLERLQTEGYLSAGVDFALAAPPLAMLPVGLVLVVPSFAARRPPSCIVSLLL